MFGKGVWILWTDRDHAFTALKLPSQLYMVCGFFLKALSLSVNLCCYVLRISVFSKVSFSFFIVIRRVKRFISEIQTVSYKRKLLTALLYSSSRRQIRQCLVSEYPVIWCAAHLQLIYASAGEKDVQHLSKDISYLLVLVPSFKIQQWMQALNPPSLTPFFSWNLWLCDLFLIFHSLIFSRCF